MPRPAVFLDRDDTLIANAGLPAGAFAGGRAGDLADPAFVRLLPGVRGACVELRRAGFALVVVSNQGVVARGGATLGQVEATSARMAELLADPDHPGRSLLEPCTTARGTRRARSRPSMSSTRGASRAPA